MTKGHSERHFVAIWPKNRYLCGMKPDQLIFRPAVEADAPRILDIIRQAQARMRARGSSQGQKGHPARGGVRRPEEGAAPRPAADIARDIVRSYGHVLADPDTGLVEAYGAVVFEGEPAYEAIDGRWLTDLRYVMVHRLAVAEEQLRRGLAREFMRRVEQLALRRGCGSFRVDTNFDNSLMLGLLASSGFVRCGEIHYGPERREAFEKVLTDSQP